jgi:hypothetical protein
VASLRRQDAKNAVGQLVQYLVDDKLRTGILYTRKVLWEIQVVNADPAQLTVAISEPVTATDTNPSMAEVRKRAVASVTLCRMMQSRFASFISEGVLKATARQGCPQIQQRAWTLLSIWRSVKGSCVSLSCTAMSFWYVKRSGVWVRAYELAHSTRCIMPSSTRTFPVCLPSPCCGVCLLYRSPLYVGHSSQLGNLIATVQLT